MNDMWGRLGRAAIADLHANLSEGTRGPLVILFTGTCVLAAGGVRQPGEPATRAKRGPAAGDRSVRGAGRRQVAHRAPARDGERAPGHCGRRARSLARRCRQRCAQRVTALPVARTAGLASHLPLAGGLLASDFEIEGRTVADPSALTAHLVTVTTGYVEALRPGSGGARLHARRSPRRRARRPDPMPSWRGATGRAAMRSGAAPSLAAAQRTHRLHGFPAAGSATGRLTRRVL